MTPAEHTARRRQMIDELIGELANAFDSQKPGLRETHDALELRTFEAGDGCIGVAVPDTEAIRARINEALTGVGGQEPEGVSEPDAAADKGVVTSAVAGSVRTPSGSLTPPVAQEADDE